MIILLILVIYILADIFPDWALPDQLVFSTVTALLRLAGKSADHRERIVSSVIQMASETVSQMKNGTRKLSTFLKRNCYSKVVVVITIITHAYPALHGLYRALISTPFQWTIMDWLNLSNVISELLEADIIDRLNNLVADVVQLTEENAHIPQTILSRYVGKERPLSGYFAVCCVMEILWTVLAQALVSPSEELYKNFVIENDDAAAANAAWNALAAKKVHISSPYPPPIMTGLRQTLDRAMECFTDLLAQMGELEGEPSLDTYAWETMAECLVRSRQLHIPLC